MQKTFSGMSELIEDRTRAVLEREWGVILDARTVRDTGIGEASRWVRVERPSLGGRMVRACREFLGGVGLGSVAR